ncbi:MAG: aminoacyl-tRNA hydrolase [Candidatus Pacebacteria bacterium]|nr:aminoacyl-tRNA hydrolase [Candidatus Paceibacterota bacterium]
MILIAGLGNPEERYKGTRHNLGSCLIDKFAEINQFPDFKLDKKSNSLVSEKDGVVLAKPQTFMNESGKAIKRLLNEFYIPFSKLFVVHDEADIALGEIKVSKGSSSAGHKGVQSIIDEVKTKDFTRIRVGIDSEDESFKNKDLEEAVLKKFSREEKEILKQKTEEMLRIIKETAVNEE